MAESPILHRLSDVCRVACGVCCVLYHVGAGVGSCAVCAGMLNGD